MQTPLKQTQIKQAFLFACFTGLRISDVRNLQWSNIKTDGNAMSFEIIMKKTGKPLAGKIPNAAKEWMPEQTDSPLVFANLPTASNIDTVIRRWVAQSGIKKHVTFHAARHTFATMGTNPWHRFIYRQQTARSQIHCHHAGLRPNHRQEERRSKRLT